MTEPMPAVGALRHYIDTYYKGSIGKFSRAKQLDTSGVSKLLRGETGERMTVKAAAAIEDATEGVVRIRMWLPE